MNSLSTSTRVTVGLVCLSLTIWLLASMIGILPDEHRVVFAERTKFCESISRSYSLLTTDENQAQMNECLAALVNHRSDIVSAAIRDNRGAIFAQAGNHEDHWNPAFDRRSAEAQMQVPVRVANQPVTNLEIRFRELTSSGWFWWFQLPLIRFLTFAGAMSYLVNHFYLRSMLEHLDPSRLIPERIRTTLDSLAEGLIVVDQKDRIVLANRSFADFLGVQTSELLGRTASELPWEHQDAAKQNCEYPWLKTMREGSQQLGHMLALRKEELKQRIFKVNSSPILSPKGKSRGALVSFDDVTLIEKNRANTLRMLDTLTQSRDEIQRQNLELERLATRDPLTSCLNRRAFFRELEDQWSNSARGDQDISCVMIDLDHFKTINDTKGHTFGDQVLRKVSRILRESCRNNDHVCRYGGEEFCILLPTAGIDAALSVAESCRKAIEATQFEDYGMVTASLGISSRTVGARSAQQLIDQADKCLYVAKRAGRNQVVRWDKIEDDPKLKKVARSSDSQAARSKRAADEDSYDLPEDEQTIPFHAVTALVSALGYRDPTTAEHCRRVADLCVATASGLLSARDSYILETAALLHDIGKIGVPDSLLLKPGPLTQEEWQIMNKNDRIGQEIVQTTFSNPALADIVTNYRAWYSGNPLRPELPTGVDISLSARILAIADAYDSMVTDRVYRKGRDCEGAFKELRRCATKQFDPDLVERFIEAVSRPGCEERNVGAATKAAAINLGAQTERLANALESRDLDGIVVLANRLRLTAQKHGIDEVVQVATTLEEAASSDSDAMILVKLTSELLELCRSTQRSYLDRCQETIASVQEAK